MLTYTEHATISLKSHAAFNEAWLQGVIADNPSILGLGELTLIERERRQESGGRLDLLLADDSDTRYEVELQLGATDERHIIRCIDIVSEIINRRLAELAERSDAAHERLKRGYNK